MKKRLIRFTAAFVLTACSLLVFPEKGLADTSTRAAGHSPAVTEAAAQQAAFQHADVKKEDVSFLKLEYEKDSRVYELDFYVGATEYEYKIDADSGVVRKAGSGINSKIRDGHNPISSTAPDGLISEADAKSKALKHAGVKADDVILFQIELDYKRADESEYEIEFYAGSRKYECEIDAVSGVVCKYSNADASDVRIPAPAAVATQAAVSSEADAKKIALSRVPGATDRDIKIKTELDDGKKIYEGKIIYKEMEYEFEIDAATGIVLEWECESIYD